MAEAQFGTHTTLAQQIVAAFDAKSAPSDVVVEAMREALHLAEPYLFHGTTMEHEERLDYLRESALVASVVWDLWRDYGEWPKWRQVVDRYIAEYGAFSDEASEAAVAAANKPGSGVFAVRPANEDAQNRSHAHHRWILSVDRMIHEERRWRWAQALGDDGVAYRTFLCLLQEMRAA
ncbi:MAG: hypothetical protein Q8K63_06495 [Acidimicrobiales bacterium]|nr:hypothetical protein [Acidimicrobiales bacterium]